MAPCAPRLRALLGLSALAAAGGAEVFARAFASSQAGEAVPRTSSVYPERLRGVFWMDHAGAYSRSDLLALAPGLALSFGGATPLGNRSLRLSLSGPSVVWCNNGLGLLKYRLAEALGLGLRFDFNAAYSLAQVWPTVDLGWLGQWNVPTWLASASLVYQATGRPCPEPGAPPTERHRCARWDFSTSWMLSHLLGEPGVFHHYWWQIVDGEGRPVEPHHASYVAWARETCTSNVAWASRLGVVLGPLGSRAGTAIAGPRGAPTEL